MLHVIVNNSCYKKGVNNVFFIEFILCIILLSACSYRTYKEDYCKLNGDLEYLNSTTKSLSKLNVPEDLVFTWPTSGNDYFIPVINESSNRNKKVGMELDICPPLVLSIDKLYDSCLIEIED